MGSFGMLLSRMDTGQRRMPAGQAQSQHSRRKPHVNHPVFIFCIRAAAGAGCAFGAGDSASVHRQWQRVFPHLDRQFPAAGADPGAVHALGAGAQAALCVRQHRGAGCAAGFSWRPAQDVPGACLHFGAVHGVSVGHQCFTGGRADRGADSGGAVAVADPPVAAFSAGAHQLAGFALCLHGPDARCLCGLWPVGGGGRTGAGQRCVCQPRVRRTRSGRHGQQRSGAGGCAAGSVAVAPHQNLPAKSPGLRAAGYPLQGTAAVVLRCGAEGGRADAAGCGAGGVGGVCRAGLGARGSGHALTGRDGLGAGVCPAGPGGVSGLSAVLCAGHQLLPLPDAKPGVDQHGQPFHPLQEPFAAARPGRVDGQEHPAAGPDPGAVLAVCLHCNDAPAAGGGSPAHPRSP